MARNDNFDVDPDMLSAVRPPSPVGLLTVVLPLAGEAACLTVLYLCVQAVMHIGGRCADNSMYSGAPHCPKGTGWMTPVSIWAALGMATLYYVRVSAEKGLNLVFFFWTALFWSLGFLFLAAGGGWSGWLMGGMFGVMGAGPPVAFFVSAFPKLGTWFARYLWRPLIGLGRMLTSPSSQWGTAAPQPAAEAVAAPKAAPFKGDVGAIGQWLVAQLAAAVLGVYGGIALFDRLAR